MKGIRPLVGLAISLALLAFFFRTADVGALVASLERVDYRALLPAVGLYFLGTWLRSLRWGLLLKPVASLPGGRLFRATLIGFTVNDVMPVRLGELARAFLLARWQAVPPAATLGTIVVERLFDGLTLCGILALAWLWLPLDGWLGAAALLGALAFTAGLLGAAFAAFCPHLLLALARRFSVLLPKGTRDRALGLLASFLSGMAVLRQGRVLVWCVGLSLVAWLAEASLYYLIMLGFGFDAGPLASLLGMAAGNLATVLPSSPGFIGTFDVALQGVLVETFGVASNVATSYTLVVHAALLLPVVAVGLLLLWREGLSLGDLRRRVHVEQRLPHRSTDTATRPL